MLNHEDPSTELGMTAETAKQKPLRGEAGQTQTKTQKVIRFVLLGLLILFSYGFVKAEFLFWDKLQLLVYTTSPGKPCQDQRPIPTNPFILQFKRIFLSQAHGRLLQWGQCIPSDDPYSLQIIWLNVSGPRPLGKPDLCSR